MVRGLGRGNPRYDHSRQIFGRVPAEPQGLAAIDAGDTSGRGAAVPGPLVPSGINRDRRSRSAARVGIHLARSATGRLRCVTYPTQTPETSRFRRTVELCLRSHSKKLDTKSLFL